MLVLSFFDCVLNTILPVISKISITEFGFKLLMVNVPLVGFGKTDKSL